VIILPLLARLAQKRLQINTYMLLIITNTVTSLLEVSTSLTLDDPEPSK